MKTKKGEVSNGNEQHYCLHPCYPCHPWFVFQQAPLGGVRFIAPTKSAGGGRPPPSETPSGGSIRRCPCRPAARASSCWASVRSLPPVKPVQPNVVTPWRLAHSTARRMFGLLPEPLMAISRSPGLARFLSCSTKTRSKPSSLPQARM